MSNTTIAFNVEKSLKLVGTKDANGTITGTIFRVTGQRGRPVAAVESVTLKGQGKAASTYRATVNGTAYTFRDYVKVPGKIGRPKGSKNKPKGEAVAA